MIQRKLEPIILDMLKIFRIVAINGPRQSGKTTLQRSVATSQQGMKYYTFDDITLLDAATSDANGFITYITKDSDIAIDEVQMVPDVIPAIKMAVDKENKKGMFLLTGSSDMFKNAKIKESLAGRMVSFNLFPLSYAEINGRDINIIDQLFSDDFNSVKSDVKMPSKEALITAVIHGGYPEVYELPQKARKAWFDFYIKARVTKDIATIDNVQLDTVKHLHQLLKVLAGQVGSLVNYTSIAKSIGIADKTVAKYIQLLEALYIVKLVPSYSNNMLKKVTKSPKVHFIDSGLVSYLLNVDVDVSMVGKNEYLGNLVETFVYSELIKHQTYATIDIDIYHFRDQQKKEVDFILESSNGAVVALEIKSGTNIKPEHFKGLVALAKTMQNRDFKGILLYGGDEVLPYKVDTFQFWIIPLKIFI
jgi:predicted AAA+ superfamily ATPase